MTVRSNVYVPVVLAVLVSVLSCLPVVALRYDRWDGAIIADFLFTRDVETIRIWFMEGQGPITLYYLRFINALNGIVPLFDWSTLSFLGSILALLGVWMTSRTLGLSRWTTFAAVAIYALSPMTTLIASSMIGVINAAIASALIGFALSQRQAMIWRVLGAVLMILSLETQSNLVLLLGLLSIVTFKAYLETKRLNKANIVLIGALPLALYLLYYRLFIAVGVYSSYNKYDMREILKIPGRFIESPFLTSFILPLFCVGLMAFLFAFLFQSVKNQPHANVWLPVALIGVAVCVTAPYLLVGKQPEPFSLFSPVGFGPSFQISDNSNYRHAQLPSICMALAIASLAEMLGGMGRAGKSIAIILLSFISAALTVSTLQVWPAIFDRDTEIEKLVNQIDVTSVNGMDLCFIDTTDMPRFHADKARFYELNHYAGLAGSNRSTLIVPKAINQSRLDLFIDITCRSDSHKSKYGAANLDCSKFDLHPPKAEDLQSCDDPDGLIPFYNPHGM